VVVDVTIAMVVVVAGVPVEVESPLRVPEIAGAPVIPGEVIAHRCCEVAVVIVAVNIAVTVVVAGSRIPVVTPFWMPILTGASVVARELADLGRGHGCPSYVGQPHSCGHDECRCCTACQCLHAYHDNTGSCAPVRPLRTTRCQCGPKSGVSNGIGVALRLSCAPL
jgi:hypothetical protein